MHTCPMQTPAFPSPIPHVGGPVVGPGVPNVLNRQDARRRGGRYVRLCRSARHHRERLGNGDDWRKACRPHGRHHGTRRLDSHRMPHGNDRRINPLPKVGIT